MRTRKLFTIVMAGIYLFATFPSAIFAESTPPAFPSCLNPQGTVEATYTTGTHGIAGNQHSFSGADVVYHIDTNSDTQCFCDTNGNGIQTNWWKVSSLDQSEINYYQTQGWIYEPQGTYWGLDNAPYLAMNSTYSCNAPQTGIVEGTAQSSSTGNSSINNANNSVQGLAYTGNILIVYASLVLALSSLLTSFILGKRN